MADTCWFCKKNPEDPTKTLRVPFYKEIQREFVFPDTTKVKISYSSADVRIPRCSQCAENHIKESKVAGIYTFLVFLGIITFVGLFILLTTLNPTLYQGIPDIVYKTLACLLIPGTSFTCMLAYEKFRKDYLKSRGTLPKTESQNHPSVEQMLLSGYKIGIDPSDNVSSKEYGNT